MKAKTQEALARFWAEKLGDDVHDMPLMMSEVTSVHWLGRKTVAKYTNDMNVARRAVEWLQGTPTNKAGPGGWGLRPDRHASLLDFRAYVFTNCPTSMLALALEIGFKEPTDE